MTTSTWITEAHLPLFDFSKFNHFECQILVLSNFNMPTVFWISQIEASMLFRSLRNVIYMF